MKKFYFQLEKQEQLNRHWWTMFSGDNVVNLWIIKNEFKKLFWIEENFYCAFSTIWTMYYVLRHCLNKKSHLKFSLMLPLKYTWWVLDWSRRRFLIRIGPGVLFKDWYPGPGVLLRDWYPGPGVLLRDEEPFIKLGLTLVSILSSSLYTGFSLISILLFIVEFLMSSDKGELLIFSSILDLCSLRLDFSSVLKY